MSKPVPESIDPSRVTELALAVVKRDRFPYLATIDGDQPRVRPVSPVRTDGFTAYVANLRAYHKTVEIQANPKVELCYLDETHDQVRITGTAELVTDRGILQAIWDANPLLRQYLGSIDNSQLIVYRIVPAQVRFMREWRSNITTFRWSNHTARGGCLNDLVAEVDGELRMLGGGDSVENEVIHRVREKK